MVQEGGDIYARHPGDVPHRHRLGPEFGERVGGGREDMGSAQLPPDAPFVPVDPFSSNEYKQSLEKKEDLV
jgi:hypothetical protein